MPLAPPARPARPPRPRPLLAVLALLVAVLGALDKEARGEAQPLVLGCLSFLPPAEAMARWQPLADYLSAAIPGHRVELRVLNQGDINLALEERRIDLLLCSPSYYVSARHNQALSGAIATLVGLENGLAMPKQGGVIFTRADRHDLSQLADLAGRTIATAGQASLTNYQVQAWEIRRAGVDIARESRILTIELPLGNVVEAVLGGKADAGFVRTGFLEALQREKGLDLRQIKIMHLQTPPDFPLLTSTQLYPEWPFVALAHVPDDIIRRLAAALFGLEHDTPIARRLGIHGFTIPANYTPVEELMQGLGLPPFDDEHQITLANIWARYRWWLLPLLVATALILLLALRLQQTNRRLRRVYTLADEERTRLRRIGDNLPDSAVFQYTRDWEGRRRILYISEGIERISGLPVREVEGTATLFERIPPETSARLSQAEIANLRDMHPLLLDLPLTRQDGHDVWLRVCANPRVLSHQTTLWDGVMTDITERKQMEASLRENEARLAQAQAMAHIGSWEWDLGTDLLTWSDETFRIFGYQPQAVPPSLDLFWRSLSADSLAVVRQALDKALRGERPYDLEFPFRRADGGSGHCHARAEVIRDDAGQPLRLLGTMQDITAQVEARRDVQASEARFRGLFASAQDGILIYQLPSQRLIAANPAICGMLGYTEEELLALGINDIHPAQEAPAMDDILAQHFRGDTTIVTTLPALRKDGERIYVDVGASLLPGKANDIQAVAIFRDVTERKRQEDALRAALEEKDILVKEVHHRVKNNLQVITSMLNIQSRRQIDPSLAAALVDLRNRVRSMALIHEKLYRSADLANIEFLAYMRELATSIVSSSTLEGGSRLGLEVNPGPPVWLPLDQAIPCGLIVNELVTNSVKHAFPGRDSGQIRLAIGQDAFGMVELSVSDTGIGMPSDVTPNPSASLGLTLVAMLVRQLHGTLSMDCGQGTTATLRFQPQHQASDLHPLPKD